MTKKVRIVLDSCRADNFKDADVRLSYANVTFPSAAVYLGLGFGYDDNIRFDNMRRHFEAKERTRVLVDNPYLHPNIWPWNGLKRHLLMYKYFETKDCNTDEILEFAKQELEDDGDLDSYTVLWLMDTHSPYYIDTKANATCISVLREGRARRYNQGEDCISDNELKEMRMAQQAATENVAPKIQKFLKSIGNCQYIITADHGESFGENHRFGHGTDIHPVQFRVPFIKGEVKE